MDAAEVIQDYMDSLDEYGEPVQIRRFFGSVQRSSFAATARARVKTYRENELTEVSQQGRMWAKVLIQDLVDAQFPLPIEDTDKIVIRGEVKEIDWIDNNTGRVGTTQVYALIYATG